MLGRTNFVAWARALSAPSVGAARAAVGMHGNIGMAAFIDARKSNYVPAGRPNGNIGETRMLHGSRVALGMFDSFTQSWNNVKEETLETKKQEAFSMQVNYLVKRETLTLEDLKEIFTQSLELMGVKGWRKHMPGVANSAEYLEVQKHLNIINAMTNEQKADPGLIRGMEKLRIQKETGCTAQDINKTIKAFKEIDDLHKWLRKRAETGKPIPQSTHQMLSMMLAPDGGMSRKIRR